MQFLMYRVNSVGSQAGIYMLYLDSYTFDSMKEKMQWRKIESVIEDETYIQKRIIMIKIMNL